MVQPVELGPRVHAGELRLEGDHRGGGERRAGGVRVPGELSSRRRINTEPGAPLPVVVLRAVLAGLVVFAHHPPMFINIFLFMGVARLRPPGPPDPARLLVAFLAGLVVLGGQRWWTAAADGHERRRVLRRHGADRDHRQRGTDLPGFAGRGPERRVRDCWSPVRSPVAAVSPTRQTRPACRSCATSGTGPHPLACWPRPCRRPSSRCSPSACQPRTLATGRVVDLHDPDGRQACNPRRWRCVPRPPSWRRAAVLVLAPCRGLHATGSVAVGSGLVVLARTVFPRCAPPARRLSCRWRMHWPAGAEATARRCSSTLKRSGRHDRC